MVNLLYFASLREALDTDREQLELGEDIRTIEQLKAVLIQRGGSWATAFTSDLGLLVSVNQQMADEQTPIQDGDEIAFFPPVTGG